MTPAHAAALHLAADAMRAAFPAGHQIRTQFPLVLSLDTDPLPDFAVVPGQIRDFKDAHPTTAVLVGEVADDTLEFEMTTKAALYATANVPDYWVVDLPNRLLHVHRDPTPLLDGGMTYRTRTTHGPADTVSPLVAPTATVRVADLLP